jgi:hypothetical protein
MYGLECLGALGGWPHVPSDWDGLRLSQQESKSEAGNAPALGSVGGDQPQKLVSVEIKGSI